MYIVIEGVIGVGKTVLTHLMTERQEMAALFEQFEENPFLGDFYKDRERYAFQTEVFFLLNRYRQQQAQARPAAASGDLVADYLFAKTRLFAGMNLAGDELVLFDQLFDALERQMPRPDLVVYLQASLDTLMGRIYQRDRAFERNMDRNYIAMLSSVYETFFAGYTATPVLRLQTDNLNLVSDPAAQQQIISLITATAAGK